MTKQVYALYDSKAKIYHPPVMFNTEGEAERSFRTTANSSESNVGQYPEDFDLFFLGTYNQDTGKFNLLPTMEHKWKAVTLLKLSAIPQQITPGH